MTSSKPAQSSPRPSDPHQEQRDKDHRDTPGPGGTKPLPTTKEVQKDLDNATHDRGRGLPRDKSDVPADQ
ncbi:hypothetical protein FOB72_31065 [Cupriavidus pauculus]|uniref:Uncharacterized protein n=1 Tax=Cupriavidus pauculus TaxID=82633 RepID=A0A5P2HGH8_9BURK|nr:hypothetical protein [Cupriavidus pauculus]QET06335.1 hypothetical protein FOB72_31065 [Cupriavidus pauculus]